MKHWPTLRNTSWLEDLLANKIAGRYWSKIFDMVAAGQILTWDYQWLFACWVHDGVAIAPEVNLVSNIGFGAESTHTGVIDQAAANLAISEMRFPLSHPASVTPQPEADEFEAKHVFRYQDPSLYARARRKFSAVMPGLGR